MTLFSNNANLDEIISNNETVLIDFFANWCAPCRMLSPVLQEIEEELGCKVIKIDVDEFPNLADEFGITSIPRVFAFKNGKPVADILGFLPKEAILAKING